MATYNGKNIMFSAQVTEVPVEVVQEPGTSQEAAMSQAGVTSNFAGAIKKTVKGEVVRVDDVSPLTHLVKVRARSKNLFDGVLLAGFFNLTGAITESGMTAGVTKSIKVNLTKGVYTLSFDKLVYLMRYWVDGSTDATFEATHCTFYTFEVTSDAYIGFSFRDDTSNTTLWDETAPIQLEAGDTATAYTPYVDATKVTVVRYGADETDNKQTFTPAEDGTVDGVFSLAPAMTLTTDTENVTLEVEYNRDLDRALETKIQEAQAGVVDDVFAVLTDEDGLVHTPTWVLGTYTNTIGVIPSETLNNIRKKTDMLSFNYDVDIMTDGVLSFRVNLFDNEGKIATTTSTGTRTVTVKAGTPFRMVVEWHGDDRVDITDVDPNEHITVSCMALARILHPVLRWCALGDSITEGYISLINEQGEKTYAKEEQEGWVTKLAAKKGWELTNKAIGGTGYIRSHANAGDAAWNTVQSIDFTQFDFVTLAYGVNDWKYNQVLGAFDDDYTTPTSIYGAMRKTLETIIASNPLCKIFVITPINCSVGGTEAANWGIGYKYSNNGTLEDIFNAIKTVCDYYGIEMIDMTHTSVVNRKNIKTCLLDNVHPTAETHTVMARELGARILFN